jgi:protein-disulfide isomerase
VSSGRELVAPVALSVAVVALAVGCFTAGWWIGRSGASGSLQEARIAALEQRLGLANAPRPALPAAAAAPAAPAAQAEAPVFAEVEIDGSPTRGPANAAVTLVEFSDFQCPFCARVSPAIDQLQREYPKQVRRVFKHFPLPMHPQAREAHKAAVAAGEQGKFWEMHEKIFAQPNTLDRKTLVGHAGTLGLDVAKFEQAIDSPQVEARVQADITEGQRIGVRGTPTLVINGRVLPGALPYEALKAQVEQSLQAGVPPGARS